MKHYQDPVTHELYAYEEDGSQDDIIPAHLVSKTNAEADAIRAAQNAPTPEQIRTKLSNQIQKRLDDFAATRRYTNVDSLEKYKSLTDAQIATLPAELQTIVFRYRAECEYLVLKTAETWAVSELIETKVVSGNWPTNGAGQQPSDIADFEAELPGLDWPV